MAADNQTSTGGVGGGIRYGFGPANRAAGQRNSVSRLKIGDEIGRTGLRQWGGYVLEEWLSDLQGKRAAEMYREMSDQDPVIGAILFVCEMLVRRVTWWMEPASSAQPDQQASEFAQQCLFEDMENTWADLITEILSMLAYGYSFFE